jgi:hypothetical protein
MHGAVITVGDVGRLLDQSGGVHNRTDSPMSVRFEIAINR